MSEKNENDYLTLKTLNRPFKRLQLKEKQLDLNYLIYKDLQLTESAFFSSSIDDLICKLNVSLLSALHKIIPEKEIIFRPNYKDWVTNRVKNIVKNFRELGKLFKTIEIKQKC